MGQKLSNKPRAFGWVSISLLIHGSIIAALALASVPQMLPEGVGFDTIEVTTLEGAMPLGEQLEEPKPTPVVASVPVKKEIEKPSVKKIKKRKSKPKTVKPKDPEPLVEDVALAKAEKPKNLPTKEEISTVEEEESPAVAPAEESVSVVEEESPEVNEEGQFEDIAEEPQVAEELDPEIEEATAEELESEVAALDEEAKVEETTEEIAEPKKEPQTKEAVASNSASNKAPASTKPAVANASKASGAYGVPSGARDIKDIRQVAGNRPPQYPQPARLKKQEGTTKLLYYVTPKGRVTGMKVVKSSGHSILDNEAARAISQYRFHPGQQGYTVQDVNFKLTGKSEALPALLRRNKTSMYNVNRK